LKIESNRNEAILFVEDIFYYDKKNNKVNKEHKFKENEGSSFNDINQ